ncbi:MAG: HpcH/HpaI aldolase/citrate lyase family protein [Stellaceae bacterium]
MEIPPAPMLRPRRSVLFVPGSNPRALEKARALPADALIFDLEDAVAPTAKEEARAAAAAALAAGGYGARERVLRVNGLDTPWGHADLAAAATMPLDAVLLPKVENADRVRLAEALLEALGSPPERAVWCMVETPLGVLHARDIAAASPRLAALVLGTSDLTNDLRALHTMDRLALLPALGLVLLAARAYGLAALDGVHLDLADDAGFARACRQGRELGFDGKTLIHPKQIEAANAAFAPSAEEVAWSRRAITAHEAAVARCQGVALVDGKLIENLHVEHALRVVAIAEAIARIAAAP